MSAEHWNLRFHISPYAIYAEKKKTDSVRKGNTEAHLVTIVSVQNQ
jgi:hypothetical protein